MVRQDLRIAVSIYAAALIHTDIDTAWRHTQDPSLIVRWDLRFKTLRYLPRADRSAPQRFEFTTPLGLRGTGEVLGMCSESDGTRTQELRFRVGGLAGWAYWQYVPRGGSVRVQTRFGMDNRALEDLLAPMLRWVTARSLDRLRRCVEPGVEPTRRI
jgi:hypothetical protein